MKREQLEKILIEIFKQDKQDDNIQSAFNNFIEIACPGSYTPIFENTSTEAMLKIVEILNPSLAEEIEYWLYEAPSFWKKNGFVEIKYNGKEYRICSQTEAILFILNDLNFCDK